MKAGKRNKKVPFDPYKEPLLNLTPWEREAVKDHEAFTLAQTLFPPSRKLTLRHFRPNSGIRPIQGGGDPK